MGYMDYSESFSVQGRMSSLRQGLLLGSFSTMPTADATNLGCIVLYIGETTASYTNNRFYRCVLHDNVYSWAYTEVAEGGAYITYEGTYYTIGDTGPLDITVGPEYATISWS